MLKFAFGVLALCFTWSNDALASEDAGIFFNQIKNTKNTFSLPDSKVLVSTVKNEQVVILDNQRYVVKGKLYDLWSKSEVNSKDDIDKNKDFFPFSQLKLNAAKLLDNKVKNADYAVFIDPLNNPNETYKKVKNKLLGQKKIQLIYTVDVKSLNDEKLKRFFGFSCLIDKLDFTLENPFPDNVIPHDSPCDDRIYNTTGISMLLNITPPLIIDLSKDKIINL
ncbi:hypothetical protein ABT56_18790 [Photobacterium aquae]|uniref:Uncharacterized protein n=1 Tax=Photobacterium aquae TaxID=1195763 RepID=A0A0J1GUS4_9GAMM|nr:hypothetical protein [Photobacterium aquae]KLV03485.1 hypothetical protein ABT56_18790 [Photobacterium aquae]